jgi:Prp8 binding protein
LNFKSEIVSCATDKSVFIWDLNVCERVKKLKGHKSFVNSVSISRTETPLICTGSDDSTVRVSYCVDKIPTS